jgi:hypothetical protein
VKVLKPPSAHIRLATSQLKPTVPKPAPPGSDNADDMHVATENPYIIASSGFFVLVREVRRAPDVLDEP